jgi:hypothetical protein
LSQTPLYVKFPLVAALALVIFTAAPSIPNLLQRSIAQEQQQPPQQLQQAAYDAGKPIGDLSFEIDNVTFSHHTAIVYPSSSPMDSHRVL